MEEVWKDIEGYEGLYQVSNLGRIKSLRYKRGMEHRIMTPTTSNGGYLMLVLCKNRKQKGVYIHRLVANTFIPNIEMKSQVNHINGIKTDNRVENLEWVMPKENTNKAYEIGLKKTGKYLYNTRWIYQFDLDMRFIKKWESMTQASKELGIRQGEISKCCAGKRKKCGNYIWLNDDGLLHLLETKNAEIEILKKTIEYWKNGFERELEANRKNVLEIIKQDNIIKNQKEALNQVNKKILAQKGHLKVLNKK